MSEPDADGTSSRDSARRAAPRPIPAPEHLDRIGRVPWPDRRFVPGMRPHPLAAGVPAALHIAQSWTPDVPWWRDEGWLRGLELFDHRYFWESHEVWEHVWHQVPRDDDYAQLLQALIQGAAAVLKHHVGDVRTARRLLGRVEERLDRVVARRGPVWRGLDLDRARRRLERRIGGGPWPVLACDDPRVLKRPGMSEE